MSPDKYRYGVDGTEPVQIVTISFSRWMLRFIDVMVKRTRWYSSRSDAVRIAMQHQIDMDLARLEKIGFFVETQWGVEDVEEQFKRECTSELRIPARPEKLPEPVQNVSPGSKSKLNVNVKPDGRPMTTQEILEAVLNDMDD